MCLSFKKEFVFNQFKFFDKMKIRFTFHIQKLFKVLLVGTHFEPFCTMFSFSTKK